MSHDNAKTWLRANGHSHVADMIDEIEAEWKSAGKKSRRNWWDVLAGKKNGEPCIVAGRMFPVLAAASRRQAARAKSRRTHTPVCVAPELTGGAAVDAQGSPTQASKPTLPADLRKDDTDIPLLDENSIEFLSRQLRLARVVLVTGAGFSADAKDSSGKPLPLGTALAKELFQLCYPGEEYDNSTFGELYEYAMKRHSKALRAHLERRLTVDSTSLAPHYGIWFSQPWRRVYTLNYDTLEAGAERRFDLPRRPTSVSATATDPAAWLAGVHGRDLPVIHLNGYLSDALKDMTASPPQYGRRLSQPDSWYAAFASELAACTCIYVGTPLDEAPLWQYIQLRGRRSDSKNERPLPRSFIVMPTLSRARQGLLSDYNIQWVKASASEFADRCLAPLNAASRAGLDRLRRDTHDVSTPPSLVDVGEELARPPGKSGEYLMGAQPTWADVVGDRVVHRSCDVELADLADSEKRAYSTHSDDAAHMGTLLSITGTAGSGKSTSMMQLARHLSTEGWSVAWIGVETEASPREIVHAVQRGDYDAIFIDDIDRFGARAESIIQDVLAFPKVFLVSAALRSSRAEVIESLRHDKRLRAIERAMPPLTNSDIDSLIELLDREHKLGALKGLGLEDQREQFRARADRQLLVAMIEATSGRRFDEKVLTEWEELSPVQQAIYSVVALSTWFREGLSREDVLLACSEHPPQTRYSALSNLLDRHILVASENGERIRTRHRVIAERLITHLAKKRDPLYLACEGLAFAMASRVVPGNRRESRGWRLLKRIINHTFLLRHLDTDRGRRLYDTLQEAMHWDHHYWLQRGSLELEHGSIHHAERYLNTAYSLTQNDPFVVTAYAHMRMRKAVHEPSAIDADAWLKEGVEMLDGQIAARGARDEYPYHVMGSQSIAWIGRCRWSRDEKTKFLREVHEKVRDGLSRHPRSVNLQNVERDLKERLIAVSSGLE